MVSGGNNILLGIQASLKTGVIKNVADFNLTHSSSDFLILRELKVRMKCDGKNCPDCRDLCNLPAFHI